MDNFQERIDSLIREVGIGNIVAKCEVDQAYAQNQHQTDSFRHDDGRSHYLGGPLMEHSLGLLEDISRKVIEERGSSVRRGMVDVSEWMARAVLDNAPKLSGVLHLSGHPTVTDDGILIYDRPPIAPRDTSE